MDTIVNVLIVLSLVYFVINYLMNQNTRPKIKRIIVYPVKSCKGFQVKNWTIDSNGLKHDREWSIITKKETLLTVKKNPRISMIQTEMTDEHLILSHKDVEQNLKISLDNLPKKKSSVKINNEYVDGLIYEDKKITHWISTVLREDCLLMRKDPTKSRQIGFANFSPFMIITQPSIEELASKWEGSDFDSCCERMRPNIVLNGDFEPFSEDDWSSVIIKKLHMNVIQKCECCPSMNVDPNAGVVTKEPTKTLTSFRKSEEDGKIYFGILLNHKEMKDPVSISVGDTAQIKEQALDKIKEE